MRKQVERKIEKNPGISFSELKDSLDMANGHLQYYLRDMDVDKKGKAYLPNGYCRGCELEKFCRKKCILNVLRDEKKVRILRLLQKDLSKKEIAEEVGVDPSTLSYHLGVLEDANILDKGDLREEMVSGRI